MSSLLKSFEISYCLNLQVWLSNYVTICTCHDSWAVMTCAKLWADLISYSRKNNINFDKILIMSSSILSKTSPHSILTNSPQFVTGSMVWGASINLATSAWPRPVVAKIHVQMSQGWPHHDLAWLYELNKKKSISHRYKWGSIELVSRTSHKTCYSVKEPFDKKGELVL